MRVTRQQMQLDLRCCTYIKPRTGNISLCSWARMQRLMSVQRGADVVPFNTLSKLVHAFAS